MNGTLQAMQTLSGALSGTPEVSGSVTLPQSRDVPAYEGDYIVTPELETFVMPTNGLRMTDDVIVREIPVTYTSNLYDGITVVIG